MMPYPCMDPKLYYVSRTEDVAYPKAPGRQHLPVRHPESLYSIALSAATTHRGFPAVAAMGGGSLSYAPTTPAPLVGESFQSAPTNDLHEYKCLGIKEILDIADDFLWADEDPLMTAKVHDISATASPNAPSDAAPASPMKTPPASRTSTPAPFCTPDLKAFPVALHEDAGKSLTAISSIPSLSSRSVAPPLVREGPPSVVSLDSPAPSVVTLHSPSCLSKRRRRQEDDGVIDDEDSSSIASMSSEDEDGDNEADEFAGDYADGVGDALDDSEHGSNASQVSSGCRVRPYQAGQWTVKFHELFQYRQRHGNCLVPHNYKPNMLLARWVKRQRYQYKLFKEGKASTMTEERAAALNAIGFVWDSQETAWEERLVELKEFRAVHGHCNVPCTYRIKPPLAAWVKCQRRQYKLYRNGKPSNITAPRIQQLENLGFEWEPRANKASRVDQTRNVRRKTK